MSGCSKLLCFYLIKMNSLSDDNDSGGDDYYLEVTTLSPVVPIWGRHQCGQARGRGEGRGLPPGDWDFCRQLCVLVAFLFSICIFVKSWKFKNKNLASKFVCLRSTTWIKKYVEIFERRVLRQFWTSKIKNLTSKLVCLHHSLCSPSCQPWSPHNTITLNSNLNMNMVPP